MNRLSAAEFLRLSPASRAALMKKPRGAVNSRAVVVKNVARTRGAPVVRETARRVAVSRTYLKVAGPGRNMRTVMRNSPARLAARRIVNAAIKKIIEREAAMMAPPARRNSPKKASPARSPPVAGPRHVAMKGDRRMTWRTTYSPKTGRMKIAGNKGRLSYVFGKGVSMDHLRTIAARYNVNITGMTNKEAIANKIFRN